MPELLLELFSEEIPARMQVRGAEDLARLVGEALAPLAPRDVRRFSGPRRIAMAAEVTSGVAASRQSERGPRLAAPEQALAGFLRKHGATREELREEGAFWVLDRVVPGVDAATLIGREMPGVLRRFPWPKSMRWGGSSAFTWVRPLRRILCVLDGEVVRFDLRQGEDDGHGLVSDNLTEGHRFMAPGAFAVRSAAQWQSELRSRYVIADAAERRAAIEDGVARAASSQGLSVAPDSGLLDEVTGLVEWPVPLLGRIDAAFMDLAPEVMQVSMRVNQRYFALRDTEGSPAPWFAFAANVEADDGGAAVVAGNERVLRARFSDARHFWDLDRKTKLIDRVPALDVITFHAKLGSQGDRVRRLVRIAGEIAPLVGANVAQAQRAALLAKADLTTGMVGEFPELQGVMGRYYALHDGEDAAVADAVRDHYAPRGLDDEPPREPIAISVALADKLDQLVSFFRAGEKPTGSGDPFALRRAALGVIRILREKPLRFSLRSAFALSSADDHLSRELIDFVFDRLRVQLRAEGERYDALLAVLRPTDDDVVLVMSRTRALTRFLETAAGADLKAAFRRAGNILRIEESKEGIIDGAYDPRLLVQPEEYEFHQALSETRLDIISAMRQETYDRAMSAFAQLRDPIDRFFDNVTVNAQDPSLRRNRLGMLAALRTVTADIADFSKIEG